MDIHMRRPNKRKCIPNEPIQFNSQERAERRTGNPEIQNDIDILPYKINGCADGDRRMIGLIAREMTVEMT